MNAKQASQQGAALTERQEINATLGARFIAYLDAKPKTIETYARALRQLFGYFALQNIAQPCRGDILAFRDWLRAGHKPTTVQVYITAARLFFQWTGQEGIYPNIAVHIKGAKLDKGYKKDYLTSEQVRAVMEGIDRHALRGLRDYAILALMVTGGLRTVEVARANIGDLGTVGDNPVLYIQGKGMDDKGEYVKLGAKVEQAIRQYLKERGVVDPAAPLFASNSNNNKGAQLTTRSVSGIAKARLRCAGYDSNRLTAHSLRHTAVTLSLLAGKSLDEVQQFARHASITTTQIYNHALDRAKNGCSEAIAAAIF